MRIYLTNVYQTGGVHNGYRRIYRNNNHNRHFRINRADYALLQRNNDRINTIMNFIPPTNNN